MGAADCVYRQPAEACQGHQAAAGAAVIEYEFPTYTDAQWNDIKTVFRDELSLDADRIERQVTVRNTGPDFEESFTGMETLRERIESTVRQYRLHSDVSRLSPRREALNELRESAENLRDGILGAVAVPFRAKTKYNFPPHPLLLDGVDGDMLPATRDYFKKLLANLDRMIDQAGSRQRGNARKSARDQVWNELLAIWCEFDGKETGTAAARFLRVTSLPLMGSAVPDIPSIMRWLKRRQSKPAMNKSVMRLGTR
jgi:hypothetical protein